MSKNCWKMARRCEFRSLTSDNMDSWKSRAEQQSQKMTQQRREVESEERRYNCAKVSRKKIHRREMLGKRRHEKLHAAVARSTFSIKMCLSLHVRTTFWSSDVEKLHAAVARSTFSSQKVQNTACSDHFLKLRCRKLARRCSEKHILKSKS